MARRPKFGDEPLSRLAVWSARLGWFALAVAALSIGIVRSGLLEVVPSLATFAAALVFAVLAIFLGFGSFITIWRHGLSGLGRAFIGIFIGLVLLAYPAYLGARVINRPPVVDVSTDVTNPPRFDVLARLRPRGTTDYPAANAELQRKAYPDIAPLQVDAQPKQAFDIIAVLIAKHKWLVVDSRPPAPRRDGTLEVVVRTPVMGFREDMVIRVRQVGEGSRVDVRSASRYTLHDLGSNAQRVRALIEEIDEAVANAPEPRAQAPAQPARRTPAPANRR